MHCEIFISPLAKKEIVTAGLKCPPDIGPKIIIITVNIEPIERACAKCPAEESPFMDTASKFVPNIVAIRNADPINSAINFFILRS